jgi:hypothetical protein
MSVSAPAPLETLTMRPAGLERLADLVEVGVDAALPRVVEDRGVVDDGVQPAMLAADPLERDLGAVGVGDVELAGGDVEALAAQARGCDLPALAVARPQHDGVAVLAELAADLEADAAVGAGHEDDALAVSRRAAPPCRRCGARSTRGSRRRPRAS